MTSVVKSRSLAVLVAIVALAQAARADITVYGDALGSGWQDWSWGGITRDFARTSPVHAGTQSIGVTYTGGGAVCRLGRNDAVDISGYDRPALLGARRQHAGGQHGRRSRSAITPPAPGRHCDHRAGRRHAGRSYDVPARRRSARRR